MRLVRFASSCRRRAQRPSTSRHRDLRSLSATSLGSLSLLGGACGDPKSPEPAGSWQIVVESESAALMAVHGTSERDVWAVGADDGSGPLVLSWDGRDWERHDSGLSGDLWWVQALDDGSVLMAGSDAHVVKYEEGEFDRLPSPGLGKHIVFGLWASRADDIYAVGSAAGRNGFIWHYDGEQWTQLALPPDIPQDDYRDIPALFKVWGRSGDDVWVVGGQGVVLHGNAADGFSLVESDTRATLFTVHGSDTQTVIVGGGGTGTLLQAVDDAEFEEATPNRAGLLQGVHATDDGAIWAVGVGGTVYHERGGEWEDVDTELPVTAESLHAVWVDPQGGVWVVGGNVLSSSLDGGIAIHRGSEVDHLSVDPPELVNLSCDPSAVDPFPDASIARRWNEQLLGAIRRDTPRPTVHARNLWHASLAMWDAWAAYDATAQGYVATEKLDAEDVEAAREEALSYAAYRVLKYRYEKAVGGVTSVECFDAFMDQLGFDPSREDRDGDAPHEVGNRIAKAVLDAFSNDGCNEENDYADPDAYAPDNPLLIVDEPGTRLEQPLVWQKLLLAEAVTQNGIPQDSGVQPYIGAHWRDVTPFALQRPDTGSIYFGDGHPPVEFDDELLDAVVQVIRKTAELDLSDGERWDISPGGYGNNPLGSDAGEGHPVNPVTGDPYEPQLVLRGDFTRVLAEFWADGPHSETPPGHWNTLANYVSYHPEFERRLFGQGELLDALAWDVHLYLALNGAMHDAAIVAWELKREYVSPRPISLVRYLAGLGQRTDRDLPGYHSEGLPLVDGLIEVITAESVEPGERHAHLRRYVGELAVRSWRGEPGDRERDIGGVDWMRAIEWIPYQRRTFVTPAFPGYTSGHSTFSRSAARVLAELTGSEYFPGGLGEAVFEPGYLVFEYGPSEPLRLQWATYFDAADQAGQSRLWGGIHIRHDDYDGRVNGDAIGRLAVDEARQYYAAAALNE